jgi:hypothetical protein
MLSDVSGGKLDELIAQSRKAAELALALVPKRREARITLARSFWVLARDRRYGWREETREQFRKAAELLEGILPEDRNLEFHSESAQLFMEQASYASSIGEDSRGYNDKAIQETLFLQSGRGVPSSGPAGTLP